LGNRKAIVITVFGLAAVSVIILIAARSGGNAAPGVIIGVVVLAILGAMMAAVIAERRRAQALHAALTSGGYTVNFKPDAGAKGAAFGSISHLPNLRSGSRGISWHAAGQSAGRPIEIVEHRYVVQAGKSTHVVVHTVFSTPCPHTWPGLSLTPENFFHRIGEVFGIKDIRLEDETFNRRWRVKGDDESFAALVLVPEVQQWLASAPGRESWVIGKGRVCLLRHGRVKPADVKATAARVAQLVDQIPPELAAWAPAVSRA
jgi:hypothetical protein